MKIHVNRIPVDGLREESMYDPKILDMTRADIQVEDPIRVAAFIIKAKREIVVQADIHCALKLCCARCLRAFEQPLHTSATLNYQVLPTDVVDITEDIRQEIILAYPMIPVCRQDCRGLCPHCGQNRNDGACHCEQSPGRET